MNQFDLNPLPHWIYGIMVWMVVAHLLAFTSLFFFTWPAFFVFVAIFYMTGCLGITLGFHRLLTHRSFKAPRWLERTLATFGTLALQGSVVEWVAHHRMHHAETDSENDPHNATRGFWFSHFGWMMIYTPKFDHPTKLRKFSRDIQADPYMLWLSKPWVLIGLQVCLGLILLALGGPAFALWGVFFRVVFLYHTTWFVNSAAHIWGYRNFETKDLSTNCWWVGLLAFGEGWHNNHHAEPEAVHVSRRWWEFDLTWQVIKLLKLAGWAHDLRLPKELARRRAPLDTNEFHRPTWNSADNLA